MMKKWKDLFDDRELEELSDEEIRIDEEFEKEIQKEIDEYLKNKMGEKKNESSGVLFKKYIWKKRNDSKN